MFREGELGLRGVGRRGCEGGVDVVATKRILNGDEEENSFCLVKSRLNIQRGGGIDYRCRGYLSEYRLHE